MGAVCASSEMGAVVVSTWVIRCGLSFSQVSVRWTLPPHPTGGAFRGSCGRPDRRASSYTRQREGYSLRNASPACLRSTDSSGPTPGAKSPPLALPVTRRELLAQTARLGKLAPSCRVALLEPE